MARRIAIDLFLNGVDQAGVVPNGYGAGNGFDWPGGDGVFLGEGTFGGGSIALQMMTRNGTWVPVSNYATTTAISLAAAGMANFRAPAGRLRALIITATGVYASVVGVPQNVAG